MDIIKTPCGEIRGTTCQWSGVTAYKGIRYATAGRWEYPQEVTSWEGVYEADAYGNCCYQPRAFYNEEENTAKVFYYNEFRKGKTFTYSEDCLFLNVWTPEGAKPGDDLPVLFYIHGGGFTGGCGHEMHFDGPVWPTKGVIAVTINYRLGPLSFVCLPELTEEAGHCGNYGMYDQMCALEWVRHNIQAFGGDPESITIMGQSAGAMSVQLFALSPMAKGKFRRAVMSSGCGVMKMMDAKPVESFYPFWQAAMKKAGCDDLEAFRTLEPEKLFEAWTETKKEVKGGQGGACLDGLFVTGSGSEIFKAGEQSLGPYLCGINSEDIFPIALSKMTTEWTKKQPVPSYSYFFDRQLPGDDAGAWHSADLWYWFGTMDHCWRPFTEKDKALSEQMVNYLTNFVKSGDPNGDGLPQWTPTCKGGKSLIMGEAETHMGKPSQWKLLKTTITSKAVGE